MGIKKRSVWVVRKWKESEKQTVGTRHFRFGVFCGTLPRGFDSSKFTLRFLSEPCDLATSDHRTACCLFLFLECRKHKVWVLYEIQASALLNF